MLDFDYGSNELFELILQLAPCFPLKNAIAEYKAKGAAGAPSSDTVTALQIIRAFMLIHI